MRTKLASLALLLVACGGPAPTGSPPTAAPSATASAIPLLILKNVWATVPDVKKLGTPNFQALDRNENVYVGDITKYGVAEFDRVGKFVRRFEAPAADGAGHIFVAGHRLHNHYVQKFDAEGKLLAEFGTTGRGDGQFFVNDAENNFGPEQIAAGPGGHVYVSDPGDFRVVEFDNSGAFVRNYVADRESSPRPLVGVAVDGAGNVYAASGGPLIKWAPDGRIVAHLELPHVNSPWGASPAANSEGDVWLWELGHRNPDGESIAIVHRLAAGS